jgi:hypothetical protein
MKLSLNKLIYHMDYLFPAFLSCFKQTGVFEGGKTNHLR